MDLNSFQCFTPLSLIKVSTSPINNLQKSEKCYFQRSIKISFWLQGSFKTIFWKSSYNKILTLCFTFPINGFNFYTQKFTKIVKNSISKGSEHFFWPQCSFRTIFWNTSYDQRLIQIVLNALPHFSRKHFHYSKLCHSKICKNLKMPSSKRTLKPFPKKFNMSKFWSGQFLMLCLAFPANDFNFDFKLVS